MTTRTWQKKLAVVFGILAFGVAGLGLGLGSGCGDDEGYSGPSVPLYVSAVFTIQPGGSAFIMVTTADSISPINLVTDASVSINGLPIPAFQGGYMYQGPFSISPGDDVTLTVRRGLTITATIPFPGRAEFVAPSGGSFDPQQPITVEWTLATPTPQRYHLWISDDYTDSIMGWSETVDGTETTVEILGGELLSGQTGVTIRNQSETEIEADAFEGEALQGSYFVVSNHSESAAFSTQ